MKKSICAIFIALISILILASCSRLDNLGSPVEEDVLVPTMQEEVNFFSNFTMEVKKGSVSPSGLTVVLINKSDQEGMYGEDFRLERRIHDEWIQVKVTIEGNYGFNDIGFNLNSKSQALWTADWTWLYGLLDPGEYRIIKTLLDFRETGDFGEQELSAEFTFK